MAGKTDRFLTRHPAGKRGTSIDLKKYDAMKKALLKVIPRRAPGTPFKDLPKLVTAALSSGAFGPGDSVSWYVTTVKLDLEARGLIRRLPGAPQTLVRQALAHSGATR